ncbi:MAG: D-glycero-beta-D-manno-heptose-7-phosphate kinase [Bacteroidetes bacterium]|nr:D-glycero-beta-D-manno-heptose-7-phosphate kinase [Bacteroidota bacterium]MBU1114115.1 D-glycero-beta-D-manno-heptose-7-phosphate kinase [Bacteroidota bacterium]MBU1800188.1 D-glycero-beta-D-manno-heptose-7-phosphate kinase [Bacteroidota bacterium]
MIDLSKERLTEIKNKFRKFNVAIIGDMMLDGYLWGEVNRISPEAPVPIVEIDNEFFRFGGAANVALNVAKLGANAIPFGLLGDDDSSVIFKNLILTENMTADFLLQDSSRPTTTKTRVISSDQQIVRIDKESKNKISNELEIALFNSLKSNINNIDAIILEDYNKGVLSQSLILKIIDLANSENKVITVDPKFENFFTFNNVTVFKPNLKETEDSFGIKIHTKDDIENIGFKLLEKISCKYLLLTLGADGMAIFEKDKPMLIIPTKARKVMDVSGAGDTVISTLTIALLAGATISEATYLANFAGGLVCEEAGVVPIEIDKLFSHLVAEIK